MLVVNDLWHGYGNETTLSRVDFSVDEGDFVAIVGPSGCGKSTLLKVLAGLREPSSGSVTVGNVAYVPQKDLLLPWRRALANSVIGADIAGLDKVKSRRRARDLFQRFGLGGYENHWPHQLSGGMRQRVAMLRGFLTPHPVMLLDEPFGALDALTRREMQRWLEDVWMTDRRTTLLVTHDVDEALMLADRILVMSPRPGQIVLDQRVEFARPRVAKLSGDTEFVWLKGEIFDALQVV